MDPEGCALLCIHCICQLYFSEHFTVFLLKILKFPFWDMDPEPDKTYLEMHTDHANGTPTLSTIINTMPLLFLYLFGYIFTNYHIRKCAQTM